jgi:pilus assembly protein CpaC
VPYQSSAGAGANAVPQTLFKPIGIKTKITPVILGERSDSISLDMYFWVTSLIGNGPSGPQTSTNDMTTSIVVRSGQSAAVGGLITNNSFTGYNRLPSNVKNPIISLYASKDFERNQSQFVVFVTPIIKSSASSGSEKIKKKFRLRE